MNGPKLRDSERTKAALIEAATLLFSADGYEAVSVRRIAAAAGVDAALVFRYFGSKNGVFQATLDAIFARVDWFGEDRSTFGARVTALLAHAPDHDMERAALLLILQASNHPETAGLAADAVIHRVVVPMTDWLDGARAAERAFAISAAILGAAALANLIRPARISGEQEQLVAKVIQDLVDVRESA